MYESDESTRNLQNRSSSDSHYLLLMRLKKTKLDSNCAVFSSFLYIFVLVPAHAMNETKNLYIIMFFSFCRTPFWFVIPWALLQLIVYRADVSCRMNESNYKISQPSSENIRNFWILFCYLFYYRGSLSY